MVVGLAVFAAMLLILNRTKIGLLIRAGVENKEMVEAMGYRIRRLFVGVFVAGSALAGLGGALWGMYQESVTVHIGANMMVLIFIVIIIGGLGSIGGCFAGALLVGLVANYVGYLSPKIALGSNILLMVLVLLWRPQGLYPVSKSVISRARLPLRRPAAQPDPHGDAGGDLRRAGAGAVPVSRHAAARCRRQGLRLRAAGGELRPAARLHRHRVLRAHHVLRHRRLRRRRSRCRAWRSAGRAIALGTAAAVALSLVLSFLIGLFSLRVKAIFFAMITLAVASFFAILASQLSNVTGGEDGITFKVPELLRPAYRLLEEPFLGATIGGRFVTYYLVFGASLALFLALLRVVNSPFGRVLLAIRENDFRAEALGYRTVIYRTIANCLGAVVATLAGVLYALWLRYTGPNTTLDFAIMIDILLMVVIGGMGTMYGAVIGATIFVVAQNYLQEAMKAFSGCHEGRAAAARPVPSRPLAAVAGRAVRAFGLLLPARHRRPAAREGQGNERRHRTTSPAKAARSTTRSGARSTRPP